MVTVAGHRELRAVAVGWQHPADGASGGGSPRYVPLFSRADWHRHADAEYADADYGRDPADYMPPIPEGTPYQWMLYETTTEGTPVSPPFDTPAELAEWAAAGAYVYADERRTAAQWLEAINAATVTGSTMILRFI